MRPKLRRFLKRACRRLELEAFERRPDHHYVPDFYGRSAYKQVDIRQLPVFSQAATKVLGHGTTLLYYDRLYTLFQAVSNVRRVASQDSEIRAAEVGVYRGGSSYFLATVASAMGLDRFVLHAFDTFEGHPAQDIEPGVDRESVHHAGLFGGAEHGSVANYLAPFPNIRIHVGRVQDTAAQVAALRFALVHIDVDIHAPTAFALEFFGARLAVGGLVVVDDYGFETCPGARAAVDEFVARRRGYTAIHLLTGQCALTKTAEGDDHRL